MAVSAGCRSEVDWFSGHSYQRIFSISFSLTFIKELRSGWSVWFAQIVGVTECMAVSVGCRNKVDWFSGHSYQRIFSISFYTSHSKELRSGWSVWSAQIVGVTECMAVSAGCRSEVDWFSGHSYLRIFSISFYISHCQELRFGWSVWFAQIVGSQSAWQSLLCWLQE